MKLQKKAVLVIVLLVSILLAGCAPSGAETIEEIPSGAKKITTIDLTGQTGTYTDGDINVWTDGYLILDVNIKSGTVNTIEIADLTLEETIHSIKKPKKGIYDSVIYGYRSGRDYGLNFVNSKNLTGSIDVYFIPND